MKRPDIIIGIDPDVDKSGVAALNCRTKGVKVGRKRFPDLIDSLRELRDDAKKNNIPILVVVEASWLISHNWHTSHGRSAAAIAKTGYNVGRNHQVGMLIVECCRAMGLEVKEQMPLKKMWKGADGKITHEELSWFIVGLPKQTNNEERDAALLAWNEANFPIKVKL
jgi:hypothetical protein